MRLVQIVRADGSHLSENTDITKEDYELLCKYKNQELFKGLSVKKLELTNTVLHPTVDEIAEYIGIPKNS